MKPRFLWNIAAVAFAVPGVVLITVWHFGLAPNPIPTEAVLVGGFGTLPLHVAKRRAREHGLRARAV